MRDDLERADTIQQDHGVAFPFKNSLTVLGLIFCSDNKYFTGMNSVSSTSNSRLHMIMMFRRIGGLSLLSSYMNDRVGSTSLVLQSIVSAARELLVDGSFIGHENSRHHGKSGQQKNIGMFKQMQIKIDEVQGIALATTQHLLAIEEGILKETPLDSVNRCIQASKAIYNRIETLQDELVPSTTNNNLACTTEKFFEFWRAFSLKLVRSASSSLKSFGWDQIAELVDESNGLRPPPQGYRVSGAGTAFINGSYMLDPQRMARIRYVKVGGGELSYTRTVPEQEQEGGGQKITLFRCTMRLRRGKWWFLSEADEIQPGTDKDVDYYQHKSNKDEEDSPSLSGWLVCRRGADPPPTLEPIVGPSSDGRANIEHQLVEWVKDNDLLEAVRDIDLSSKVARSVLSLYKFMAIRHDESHLESVNRVMGDHIQPILSACQKSTNLVTLAELYLQFVIILPSLPSNLQTIFDQGIKLILGKYGEACLPWRPD